MWRFLATAAVIAGALFGAVSTARAGNEILRVPTANRSSSVTLGIRAIDPARSRTTIGWMIEYQTCALLYNHPDVDRSTGGRAQPEVAEDWPTVSADGLTYTIHLRPGFMFSDGSAVTPSAYMREIERVQAFPDAIEFANDIDVANSVADDANGTLTLKLTAPHADIVERLAMPFFCPVPPGTPTTLLPTDPRPPDSGPYMRAPLPPTPAATGQTSISLVRNPYYGGTRPRNAAGIDFVYVDPADTSTIYAGVNSGTYDAAVGLAPANYATAGSLWGPGSANALAGRQRFFVEVADGMDFLALRSSPGPAFPLSDVRLRQAVNYLLDRPAYVGLLPAYSGTPWSQMLPPSVPGFVSAPFYPDSGPDLATAQALVAQTGLPIPIPLNLYAASEAQWPALANAVKGQLENGGLFAVTVSTFPTANLGNILRTPTSDFDVALVNWLLDYFDPGDFLVPLMHEDRIPNGPTPGDWNISYFDSGAWLDGGGNTWTSRFDAASAAPAPQRYDLFGAIAGELAPTAPIAPIRYWNWRVFVSDRMGCVTVHPVYQLALGALCFPPADPTPTAARETITDSNGGTVATSGDATPSDPVVAAVTTPVPGTVTINEASSPTEIAPANYSFYGREVTIEAPQTSGDSPLTLAFTLDLSLLNGADPLSALVFRDGAPITARCAAGTAASPDPCLVGQNQVVGDDVVITVRSSHASRWNFGRRFAFDGFFQPVETYPTLNSMHAGAAVPVKFSLGGDLGLSIFATGYPRSAAVSCSASSSVDPIEQMVGADASRLTYDSASGRYTFVWKTDKAWAASCRQLVLRFADGSEKRASFKFTK
jgi:ABC-type transport system substrate-binding protein